MCGNSWIGSPRRIRTSPRRLPKSCADALHSVAITERGGGTPQRLGPLFSASGRPHGNNRRILNGIALLDGEGGRRQERLKSFGYEMPCTAGPNVRHKDKGIKAARRSIRHRRYRERRNEWRIASPWPFGMRLGWHGTGRSGTGGRSIGGCHCESVALRSRFAAPLRGNVTLPDDASALSGLSNSRSIGKARITWRSSDPATISDTDIGRGHDVIRKGRVTRGPRDRRIRLTATVVLPITGRCPSRSTSPSRPHPPLSRAIGLYVRLLHRQ